MLGVCPRTLSPSRPVWQPHVGLAKVVADANGCSGPQQDVVGLVRFHLALFIKSTNNKKVLVFVLSGIFSVGKVMKTSFQAGLLGFFSPGWKRSPADLLLLLQDFWFWLASEIGERCNCEGRSSFLESQRAFCASPVQVLDQLFFCKNRFTCSFIWVSYTRLNILCLNVSIW